MHQPGTMERVFAFYRLTHRPADFQGLLAALRSATTAPFGDSGCRSSHVWREATDNALLLMEDWETPHQLERHMRSPAFRRLLAVLELSAQERAGAKSPG